MTALPSPPFITVEGIHNFRDSGGYALTPSAGSGSVRRGYLYRCADPSRITAQGAKTLSEDAGIRTIFDLRSMPEIRNNEAKGVRLDNVQNIGSVERVHAPAFKEQDYSPEAIAHRYRDYAAGGTEGFTRAYADILDNAAPSFRLILKHVAHEPDKPCVLHCSAGKDRTGVIIALILSIVGCSNETIAREYALTEQGLGPMREVILQHLLDSPTLGGDRSKAERMVASKEDYMLSTLRMIREKYGGAASYARDQCGLTEEELELIRKNLRSQTPAVL